MGVASQRVPIAAAGEEALMSRTKLALVAAGIVTGVVGPGVGSAVTAAATPPLFYVEIGSCFSGVAASSPSRNIEITWQNSNRVTKAHFTTTTDQNGYWAPPPTACDTVK